MSYSKYPCLTDVMWRGKLCQVRAIQHGHATNPHIGNVYTLHFEIGKRHHDYKNVPEYEISPVEDVFYVAQGGAALPVRLVK